MKITKLPTSVEDFVRKNIKSVWQLELLLHLRASGRSLWPREIASALYLTTETVTEALVYFETRGLVEHSFIDPNGYVFAPSSSELREAVDQTARAYNERKVAVINLIFQTPFKQVADGKH